MRFERLRRHRVAISLCIGFQFILSHSMVSRIRVSRLAKALWALAPTERSLLRGVFAILSDLELRDFFVESGGLRRGWSSLGVGRENVGQRLALLQSISLACSTRSLSS